MYKYTSTDLLFGKPVQVSNNVYVKIPTIKDVCHDERFDRYSSVFTIMTRQIFARSRDVDTLEMKYPSVWNLMWDEQMNVIIGKLFGDGLKLSDVIIEGLCYWTGLENDDENGFKVLSNNKIVHIGSEWVIDLKEFNRFVGLIKIITNYQKPEDLAPKITSDIVHQKWLNFHDNIQRINKRKAITWADKIIILSVSGNSYIPIEEIEKMTVFHFYQLMNVFGKQDAYHISWDVFRSSKFESKNGSSPKHWKETFKVTNVQ